MDERIIEYAAMKNTVRPAILPLGSGSFYVFAAKNTWVFPWRYKDVQLNIDELNLPEDVVCLVTDGTPDIRVRTNIIDDRLFPEVSCKSSGFLPYKIHAGEFVAIVSVLQLATVHYYDIREPKNSV